MLFLFLQDWEFESFGQSYAHTLSGLFLRSARPNSAWMINSSLSRITLETCSIDKSYPAYSLRIIDNLPLHLTLHTNSPNFAFVLYSIDT